MKNRLLAELWSRYGTTEYPAEWDGNVYGGGKLSQRFWEYFKVLSLMDFRYDTSIVNIGGGSPKTGRSFFSELLRSHIRTIVIDPNAEISDQNAVRQKLSKQSIDKAFEICPGITDCISISVLEHMKSDEQVDFCKILNQYDFRSIILTCEFHAKNRNTMNQLTTESLSKATAALTRYCPTAIEAAPIPCVNSFKGNCPAWMPLVVKLERVNSSTN